MKNRIKHRSNPKPIRTVMLTNMLLVAMFFTLSFAGIVHAQEEEQRIAASQPAITKPEAKENQPPTTPVEQEGDKATEKATIEPEKEEKFRKQPINPNSIASILFTKWEYAAILDAIKAIGTAAVRAPTRRELRNSEGPEGERYEPRSRPPPEERDISLNGLVYHGEKDWTIWLNGKRVTPDALPKEVMDLHVYKGYIELKWYDDYSQSIYPIRLKPHQRFNLDTRIFLPG